MFGYAFETHPLKSMDNIDYAWSDVVMALAVTDERAGCSSYLRVWGGGPFVDLISCFRYQAELISFLKQLHMDAVVAIKKLTFANHYNRMFPFQNIGATVEISDTSMQSLLADNDVF